MQRISAKCRRSLLECNAASSYDVAMRRTVMLGENIARIRKEKGLTQEAFAEKIHVVRQTVSKWETGMAVPDADALCRIADALEVSVSQLLGRSEEEKPTDDKALANALAAINEQIARRNRNNERILGIVKKVFIAVAILFALIVVMTILSVIVYSVDPKAVRVSASFSVVSEDGEVISESVPAPGNGHSVMTFSMLLGWIAFAVLLVVVGIFLFRKRRDKYNES